MQLAASSKAVPTGASPAAGNDLQKNNSAAAGPADTAADKAADGSLAEAQPPAPSHMTRSAAAKAASAADSQASASQVSAGVAAADRGGDDASAEHTVTSSAAPVSCKAAHGQPTHGGAAGGAAAAADAPPPGSGRPAQPGMTAEQRVKLFLTPLTLPLTTAHRQPPPAQQPASRPPLVES